MPSTRLYFSLVLVVALVASARAADVGEARSGGGLDWSGPWIGALGSGGRIGGEGALGGVAVGYAAQFDDVVLGIDGDVSGGGLDMRRLGGRYEIEAIGAIRARIGYAFGRFVAYGAAGVAFASAEFARAGERDDAVHIGWTVGAGVDIALTERLGARVEYLYVDLDRRSFDAGGGASFGPSGGVARLGLNYRF